MNNGKTVLAPVLWDNDDTFQDGKYFAVNAASIVVGYTNKPTGVFIPGFQQDIPLQQTLQIKDPVYNNLYLTTTLAEWETIVAETAQSASQTYVINWEGGNQVPSGCIISDPELKDIQILSVNKSGATIYNWVYTNGSPDGTLDITTDGCLADGENIQIEYKNA